MKYRIIEEDELEKCIENNIPDSEREEYDFKKSVNKMFISMDSYIKSMAESNKILKEYYNVKTPNDFFISKEIQKLNQTLRKTIRKVYELSLYCGCVNAEERKKIFSEQLDFSQDGERLHIVFPELLPRRIKNDSAFTSADIKQMYEKPFHDFFYKGKHIIYKKKAVIIYTHIFRTEKEFVDHDNFQTKEITDLITSWLLLDDTPKHCAIFMDYKMGEKSHTEVDVIPFNELIDFLKNK